MVTRVLPLFCFSHGLTVDGVHPPCRIRTPLDPDYCRSPIFNNSSKSRASSVSRAVCIPSAMLGATPNNQSSNWWSDILPYRPNTLPDNLVDRLRQRNSLALSRLDINGAFEPRSLTFSVPFPCPLNNPIIIGERRVARHF